MNTGWNVDPYRSRLKPPSRAARGIGGLAAALAFLCGAAGAGAQPTGGGDTRQEPGDAREDAREAQAAFERTRIAHLPWTWPRSRGPCDETVGRFCFWHETDGEAWEPPPEPAAVTEAREALLDVLAGAARRLPGDEWVAGQRVRYLVEAGRPAEARTAAREGSIAAWWGAALAGYALHAAAEYARAEAAFDEALASMPEAERERWTDLALLLEPRARRAYEGLGPDARAAFERRVWWLADPLWMVPGNERRSEHFARRALDRMQEDARSGYDVKWGHDLSELLVRYGWPIGFERIRRGAAALASDPGTRVIAHDAPGGRRFVPGWEALGGPTVAGPEPWSVEAERPRSTFAPAYARRFVDLEAQHAVFRRGESVVVVAAWALDPDSLDPEADVEAAIVVSAGPDEPPAIARARATGAAGSLYLETRARPAVVGVEALAGEARVAGRVRRGLHVPDRVSDLLVLDRAGGLPRGPEEAARRARARPAAAPGERIGVYLELYPPPGAREARVALALREAGGGFWRAIGSALGLGEDASTAELAWVEPLDDSAVRPVPVAIDLPDLPVGAYAIEVEVDWPDGTRSRVRRAVELDSARPRLSAPGGASDRRNR